MASNELTRVGRCGRQSKPRQDRCSFREEGRARSGRETWAWRDSRMEPGAAVNPTKRWIYDTKECCVPA